MLPITKNVTIITHPKIVRIIIHLDNNSNDLFSDDAHFWMGLQIMSKFKG